MDFVAKLLLLVSRHCMLFIRTIPCSVFVWGGFGSYPTIHATLALTEQTTPVGLSPIDKVARVENIAFTDLDLDRGDVGGNLSWSAPTDTSLDTHYLVYFATVGLDDATLFAEHALRFQQ